MFGFHFIRVIRRVKCQKEDELINLLNGFGSIGFLKFSVYYTYLNLS